LGGKKDQTDLVLFHQSIALDLENGSQRRQVVLTGLFFLFVIQKLFKSQLLIEIKPVAITASSTVFEVALHQEISEEQAVAEQEASWDSLLLCAISTVIIGKSSGVDANIADMERQVHQPDPSIHSAVGLSSSIIDREAHHLLLAHNYTVLADSLHGQERCDVPRS